MYVHISYEQGDTVIMKRPGYRVKKEAHWKKCISYIQRNIFLLFRPLVNLKSTAFDFELEALKFRLRGLSHGVESGLGTTFFSIRYVPFFKRNVLFFSVLFSSFGDLWDPKEGKERNVLLQRTEKNAKNAPFFCKECKITQECSYLFQYIYRYI